ncbi:MAG: chemotaxis protein CheW [Lachnospiraceae bacterium]|nr:chemotaxis protein CheW [Lachnospiraceae bacterium]
MYENHVIFQVGDQCYSINSLKVKTIEGAVRTEPLPGAPSTILGIGELRGEFHPICSLHKKFGLPVPEGKPVQYLFVETADGMIGVVTDAVRENAMIDTSELNSVPVIVRNDNTGYVSGIVRHKGELITMMDPDKILTRDEITVIKSCMNTLRQEQEKKEAELKALQEQAEKEKASE